MKNKTSKKYDILMIVWGLSLGMIELLLIHLDFFDMINIPFVKAPYAKNLLILAIVSLCFRVITYFIQQILWSIEMSKESDGSLFSIIILTIGFVIVQLPFLLPIF